MLYINILNTKYTLGTIYIAFGTLITFESIPKYVSDAFFGAFNELTDYRIIFTFRKNMVPQNVGSHVKFTKWTPQFDLLSHSKTKLFISHGGLKR